VGAPDIKHAALGPVGAPDIKHAALGPVGAPDIRHAALGPVGAPDLKLSKNRHAPSPVHRGTGLSTSGQRGRDWLTVREREKERKETGKFANCFLNILKRKRNQNTYKRRFFSVFQVQTEM
jgi:hypothetical protein